MYRLCFFSKIIAIHYLHIFQQKKKFSRSKNCTRFLNIIEVDSCDVDCLCPGTQGHELTHAGGISMRNCFTGQPKSFDFCLGIIQKCRQDQKPYVLMFQDWSHDYVEKYDAIDTEISHLLSDLCDQAIRTGLVERFLQGQPMTQPPKQPTESWMPEIRLKLGKRHRQLLDLEKITKQQLKTTLNSSSSSSSSLSSPDAADAADAAKATKATKATNATNAPTTLEDVLVAAFPVDRMANQNNSSSSSSSSSSNSTSTFLNLNSSHTTTLFLTDLADRVSNHQLSFSSTNSFATRHIEQEELRREQLWTSIQQDSQSIVDLDAEQSSRKVYDVEKMKNSKQLLDRYEKEEEVAKAAYVKIRKLRKEQKKKHDTEMKSITSWNHTIQTKEKYTTRNFNKNKILLQRCVSNLERMEGVKYWSEMLRNIARGHFQNGTTTTQTMTSPLVNSSCGSSSSSSSSSSSTTNTQTMTSPLVNSSSGSSSSSSSHSRVDGNVEEILNVILSYCMERIQKIKNAKKEKKEKKEKETTSATSNLANEKETNININNIQEIEKIETEKRGMIAALHLLKKAWFKNDNSNNGKDHNENNQIGDAIEATQLLLSNTKDQDKKENNQHKTEHNEQNLSLISSSSSSSSFRPKELLNAKEEDRVIVLYHSGTRDHRVSRAHPEQNMRVVKCITLLRSHATSIPIDSCTIQLLMPSTTILRLVHR